MDARDLAADDAYVACAAGTRGAEADGGGRSGMVNRPGGPFKLPPLVALTHSRLGQFPEFRDRLYRSAQFLLQAGPIRTRRSAIASRRRLWRSRMKKRRCPPFMGRPESIAIRADEVAARRRGRSERWRVALSRVGKS